MWRPGSGCRARRCTCGWPGTTPIDSPRSDPRRGDCYWVSRHASAVGVVCVNWQQVCLGVAAAGRNIDVWVTEEILQCFDGGQLLRTSARTTEGSVRAAAPVLIDSGLLAPAATNGSSASESSCCSSHVGPLPPTCTVLTLFTSGRASWWLLGYSTCNGNCYSSPRYFVWWRPNNGPDDCEILTNGPAGTYVTMALRDDSGTYTSC
jgi:hypothetical protein